ncbi:acyltransferase family protein [Rhizobium sp. LjRoot254]|uniref:acyltransferase family protein n=1 Tax=Rhizobium sp. LjRoot254 TaxID=3342297 RepID=UPI003ED0888D
MPNEARSQPIVTGAPIPSLQALRAFAALAVVAHHAMRAVTVNADTGLNLPEPLLLRSHAMIELGAVGVDLFFILSGFLMVYISAPYVEGRRSIGNFVLQRAIRIWPMYVIATALYLGLNIAIRLMEGRELPFNATPIRLLSFFFVPSFDASGLLQPILGVGWTLNYEMFFYLVFALALAVGRRAMVPVIAAILAGLFLAGTALPQETVAHAFLGNPILFEFLLGALAAKLFMAGRLVAVPPSVAILAGLTLLFAFAWLPNEGYFRLLYRGIPSLLIFVGVLNLDSRITWPKWWIHVGDGSYSIYLFHLIFLFPLAGFVLRKFVAAGHVTGAAEVTALIGFLVVTAIGLLIHWMIEKPLTRFLHELSRRKKPVENAA